MRTIVTEPFGARTGPELSLSAAALKGTFVTNVLMEAYYAARQPH